MTRLLIHVEGETEESFVNELLAPHLYEFGFTHVGARLLGNARMRERRGGIRAWQAVKKDILRHLQQDAGAASATFVDYYALPAGGHGAWPGRSSAGAAPFATKSGLVEQQIFNEIDADFGAGVAERFFPYVVMHEFEALLFSNPTAFCVGIGRPDLVGHFQHIRDQFGSPEEINDSPITAPSKRITAVVPGYQKPLFGTLAALEIGLVKIRSECPLFDAWVTKLEVWGRSQAL
ncbi:MAG: DUF4276 family protein [Burkholderiaceae bacterium]